MNQPAPIGLALVNDHPLVLAGLRSMLAPFHDRIVVSELKVGRRLQTRPDLVLLDTYGALDVERRVRDILDQHDTRVVIYSWTFDPDAVEAATRAGAWGYLSKQLDAGDLLSALERVHAGENVVDVPSAPDDPASPAESPQERDWPGRSEGLSEREAEMVTLITHGFTNDEIAKNAYLSINTVKTYIREAYKKIGVTVRPHAVIWGIDHGLAAPQAAERFQQKSDDYR